MGEGGNDERVGVMGEGGNDERVGVMRGWV